MNAFLLKILKVMGSVKQKCKERIVQPEIWIMVE